MNKKGALELSMNTIVVIVIGVTILSLGLVFVRNMMGEEGMTGISQQALDNARYEVGKIINEIDKPLTVAPAEKNIDIGGKTTAVMVVLYNDEETPKAGFAASVTSSDPKVQCLFADNNFKTQSLPYNIASGERQELTMGVKVVKGATIGDAVCNVRAGEDIVSLIIHKK